MIRIPKFDDGTPGDVIEQIVDYIAKQEGFRTNPYLDSEGHRTAGYGFTSPQHIHKWTEKDARNVLRTMVQYYDKRLANQLGDAYTKADTNRKIGYADLMHQAGIYWNERMPKFYAAALAGDEDAMSREINFASKQTANRNNARRNLFGYSKYENKGRRSSNIPADLSKNKLILNPIIEPTVSIDSSKPDLTYAPKPDTVKAVAGMYNKANSQQALQNIYNMAPWNPDNTLPEVIKYGTDRSNRLRMPSVKELMQKQLNPMKNLNRQFEDYVSDAMNPMKYQIKMPNIFETL